MSESIQLGQTVKHPVQGTGTVENIATFATHRELLVQWADGTAAWVHEEKLTVIKSKVPKQK